MNNTAQGGSVSRDTASGNVKHCTSLKISTQVMHFGTQTSIALLSSQVFHIGMQNTLQKIIQVSS